MSTGSRAQDTTVLVVRCENSQAISANAHSLPGTQARPRRSTALLQCGHCPGQQPCCSPAAHRRALTDSRAVCKLLSDKTKSSRQVSRLSGAGSCAVGKARAQEPHGAGP